jgi:(p)ppGpp synthase/HD superfamily hydrolase
MRTRLTVSPEIVAEAASLASLMSYVMNAHATQARKSHNAIRLWDRHTPYGIHPVWCAMTILAETTMPEDVRQNGAKALLLHDILEDTRAGLPEDTSPEVRALVEDMTFEGLADEQKNVWDKSPVILLLKLYDKVSNLLDATWMTDGKPLYIEYTRKLCDIARQNYGQLNIVTIAEAICDKLSAAAVPAT